MPLSQPTAAAPGRGLGDVRHEVGDGVEHQVDLHPGQVGADAVVGAAAAEADVGVGVAERCRTCAGRRNGLVEVGRAVEQADPLALLDRAAPPISVSRVAVRWKATTGVAQRTISSGAVFGRSAL